MTKLAFLGSPIEAALCLETLVKDGHEVKIVVTGQDRRRRRNGSPEPTPVKKVAMEYNISVTHEADDLLELAEEIDLGIVVAFGQIIKTELLTKIPLVNIHFSLLPRWRGAAPVERAILAGDKETGVCLMAVAKGLDTGDVYASQKIKIDDTVTAAELRLILTDLGIKMLTDKLSKIPDDAYLNGGKSPGGEEMLRRYFGEPIKQEGEATYAAKIGPEDLKIIWENQTSAVLRQIRLAKAWTVFRGERLIIHDAMMYSVKNVSEHVSEDILTKENDILADSIPGTISRSGLIVTGDGLIKVRKLQSSGRAVLDFDNWSAGTHLKDGERLGI